jgi:hypothetical protein
MAGPFNAALLGAFSCRFLSLLQPFSRYPFQKWPFGPAHEGGTCFALEGVERRAEEGKKKPQGFLATIYLLCHTQRQKSND